MDDRLCIAVVQQPMAWTTTENVASIVAAIAMAKRQDAALCVTPELALTGFHRKIRDEAVPGVVAAGLEQVRASCRRHGVACALGAPTFESGAGIRNSYVFIDGRGEILSTVSKIGLTPAELTFFAPGVERAVHRFAGRACTTVLCREVDDLEAIAEQLRDHPVELIFWPSIVGSEPGTVHPTQEDTDDLGYLKRAAKMARRLAAFVIQSNWPHALNTPERRYAGESKVYGPDGEVLLTLPRDEPGIGIFALGERSFRWTAIPA